jgi:hypothetical protein
MRTDLYVVIGPRFSGGLVVNLLPYLDSDIQAAGYRLLRRHLLRGWVNKGKEKGRSPAKEPQPTIAVLLSW